MSQATRDRVLPGPSAFLRLLKIGRKRERERERDREEEEEEKKLTS